VPHRWSSALLLAALVVAPVLVLPTAPAQALEPGLAFTSADLSTYQTNGIAWSIASGQGLVFVGGDFSSVRPPRTAAGTSEQPRTNFAVLDAATGAPTSCAPSFTMTNSAQASDATVRALHVSPDGNTLYIGGYFTSAGGVAVQHVAAMDIASCTISKTFRPLPNGTVRAIDATADAVYYGGSLITANGQSRKHAAAAMAVGTSNPGALLPWAPAFDADVRAIALKPDGSVAVVGGDFNSINGVAGHALTVVDTGAGVTAHAFPTTLFAPTSVTKTIAVDASGFYTGNEGTGFQVFDGRTSFNWDYTERWRDTCLGATQALVVYSGLLYSGSHAHDCSTMGEYPDGLRMHLTAERVDSPKFLPWFPNTNEGIGEGIGPRGLTVASTASGDFLWSAGEFTKVNGVAQQGLTRFGQTGDTKGPSSPTTSITSTRPGQVRVAWRQSTDTDDGTLSYRVFRDGSTTPAYTTSGTAPFWSRRQLTWTDTQAIGSSHKYKVTVSDGHNSATGAERTVKVAGMSSAYAERIAADGALAHWRYDEPGDVFVSDSTSNGSNGTLLGGATFQVNPGAVAGDPSKAISLPGSSGTIYSEQRFPKPSAYTLETWFKTTTTTGGKIVGFGDKQVLPSRVYDKMIYMNNAGQLVFGANNGTSLTSPAPYNDGAWHQVVGTQGAAGMALYVDGVGLARNAQTSNLSYSGYLRVGGDTLSSSVWPTRPTSAYFKGALDETAYYATVLAPSTVADHFALAGGTPVPGPGDYYGQLVSQSDPSLYWRLGESTGHTAADASGPGGTAGTYSGSVTFGRPGAVRGTSDTASSFSGSVGTSVAAVTSRAGTASFSAEIWLKTTSTSGGQLIGFGSAGTGSSSTTDRTVYLRNDGRISFGTRNGTTLTTITSAAAYNDDAYHHVAVTKGSAGMVLYVDGSAVASATTTAAKAASSTTAGYWRVSGDALTGWPSPPSSDYVAAMPDEVAVYPTTLSSATVLAHWSSGSGSAPDRAAPITPARVQASTTAGDVTVSWQPSLDDVAVTAYDLHRSATAGFTPTSATLVATTTRTTVTDSAVGAGTWYYRVVARDAAGNSSPASNLVSSFVTDTVPPTATGTIAVTTNASSAQLTWPAGTDNVGVADYLVYRSSTDGFTPAAANQVAATQQPAYIDSGLTLGSYYYRVQARDASGNVGAFSPQAAATVKDVAAPTTPSGVTPTVIGSTVGLDWTASTDDSAVAGYEVHRSATGGFQPSSATLVGSPTATSFSDVSVPAGSWYYRVVAKDSSGNRSDASTEVQAVVAAQPSITKLAPTADTYANQNAPSSNFGTTTTLFSRGTSGYVSYLRFDLPPAPAGTALSSVVLRIRTTTDPNAGSSEVHTVRAAGDGWTETGLTWQNRPALSGDPLGMIAAGTAVNTQYDTPLDLAGLTADLGSTRTFGITNAGMDSLSFWSRTAATSNRPQLVLTFTPTGG